MLHAGTKDTPEQARKRLKRIARINRKIARAHRAARKDARRVLFLRRHPEWTRQVTREIERMARVMSYEPKDGDISIFKNDKKGNERRPDYRGDALICGVKYTISLWVRTSKKSGRQFMSGNVSLDGEYGERAHSAGPKAQSPATPPQVTPAPATTTNEAEDGTDLPF